MFNQISCDEVVDDAIESALELAEDVVRVRMNRSVKEDLAVRYMWEVVQDFRS